MIQTLIALLFAHVFADFVFQTNWISAKKRTRHPGALILHGAIVLILSVAALGSVHPVIAVLAFSHLLIDLLKTTLPANRLWPFLTDQAAHLATLLITALIFPNLWATGYWFTELPTSESIWLLHAMLISAGAILAIRAGGFAVAELMAPYAEAYTPGGLKDGGRVIGLLERGLIFLFLMIGQPAAIGFLIAAKSVMRFDTVSKEQKAAEYVIIGTLASFGWAVAITTAVIWLQSALPPLEIPAPTP